MPLKETVNQGREFLDQFGAEGEGWQPIDAFEAMDLPELPKELLIPQLSPTAIALYQGRLTPAYSEMFAVASAVLLRGLPKDQNPDENSYTWEAKSSAGEIIGVRGRKGSINTLHTHGPYGHFKPVTSEVLGALDKSNQYELSDEAEYYWTDMAGDDADGGALWPNVPVEVHHNGAAYSVTSGAYHLGKTTISSLAIPEIAEPIMEEYKKRHRVAQEA